MGVVENVQDVFVELALDVEHVRSALDHEPGIEGLPISRPCVTMLYKAPVRVGAATGGVEELEHVWDVFVYVDVTPVGGYQGAQAQLVRIVPELLAAVREDFLLGGTCERARLTVPNEQPLGDEAAGLIWKRLELRALKAEF